MRFWLAILILFCAITLFSEDFYITIDNPDQKLVQQLEEFCQGYYKQDDTNIIELFADSALIDFLTQNGYEYTIHSTREELSRELEQFHNYAELTEELQSYVEQYGDIVQLESLGPSQGSIYYNEGKQNYVDFQHEVWCLKVSDNPEMEEDEPNVFIGGAIHARELISVEVSMAVLQYILENYGTDDEITSMVDNYQIWFVPLINPDGHKLSIEELDLWHRKNMRDNNNNQMPDYSANDGVDLNRNFGYVWGNNNASDVYYSESYHGPEAWSEPETVYLRDLIRSRRFWGAITYHSSGQYVLYPLGHLNGVCSYDHEVMGALSDEMASTIPRIDGTGTYTSNQAVDFGYTCQGTMGDWGYSEQRIFSFTIELSNTHFPTADTMNQICSDNLEAALIFIDRPANSMLTGVVTGTDDTPIVADVYIEEIDNQSGMTAVEPSRSNELFGRYIRPLLPGAYTVRFECDGYNDVTYNDVEITGNDVTEINVQMSANSAHSDVVPQFCKIESYPNPFNPETSIVLDLPSVAQVSVTIYDVKGRRVRALYDGKCEQPQLRLQWNGVDDRGKAVASGLYLVRAESGKNTLTHKIVMVQ